MYEFSPGHFVVAADQIKGDFRATCCLLEEAWKAMSGAYGGLMSRAAFEAAISKGWDVPSFMTTLPAPGAFFLGPSSAAGQPTSGAFVMPEHRE